VPFEALDEPARLGGGEGFVERGGLVGVEIDLHQHDLRRVGKCTSDKSLSVWAQSMAVWATCAQFADATLGFLRKKVPWNWADLCDLVTENFRVINPKEFRVIEVNQVYLPYRGRRCGTELHLPFHKVKRAGILGEWRQRIHRGRRPTAMLHGEP
jgi:hypothetical protein